MNRLVRKGTLINLRIHSNNKKNSRSGPQCNLYLLYHDDYCKAPCTVQRLNTLRVLPSGVRIILRPGNMLSNRYPVAEWISVLPFEEGMIGVKTFSDETTSHE